MLSQLSLTHFSHNSDSRFIIYIYVKSSNVSRALCFLFVHFKKNLDNNFAFVSILTIILFFHKIVLPKANKKSWLFTTMCNFTSFSHFWSKNHLTSISKFSQFANLYLLLELALLTFLALICILIFFNFFSDSLGHPFIVHCDFFNTAFSNFMKSLLKDYFCKIYMIFLIHKPFLLFSTAI